MSVMIETKVCQESHDVKRRISELRLTLKGLNRVRDVAIGASANATDFHPANAAGTFAYQQGTWAMRDEFVGDEWKKDTENGVEAIRNDEIKVKVIFTNVDIACNDFHYPKPRSKKGAGAERACMGNLFGNLPTYAPKPQEGWATYYIMLDPEGRAELTRPVVKGNTFIQWIERIYLPDNAGEEEAKHVIEDAVDLDPVVARKARK